jgi:hypothetical protein
MTTKRPIVVGNAAKVGRSALASYSQGIAQRAEQSRKEKPKLGNIAQANAGYNPLKDAPATLGQMFNAQNAVEQSQQPEGGFSPQTIATLKAVRDASETARAAKAAQKEAMQETAETAKPEIKTEPKVEPKLESKAERDKTAAALENMDDFELERIMRGIQNDVINNTREREHVDNIANGRINEIDFAAGVASGEFKQIVDVVPGRLKVHYRTITSAENQGIRQLIYKMVQQDPTLDKLSAEIFGLALLVASVTQIGSKAYPDHLKRTSSTTFGAEFDETVFRAKYREFSYMPQPLLHSIGVHGQWFDLRVRSLFTVDFAKNG